MNRKVCILLSSLLILITILLINNKRIELTSLYVFKEEELLSVYALNYETKKVEKVNISYMDPTIENIISIYTYNSNKLPRGYFSPLCSNTGLISYKNDEEISIIFDRFIVYSYDIFLGYECISKTLGDIYNKKIKISYK